MHRTELLELIANRGNSRVEFKRDDSRPDSLAKETSALLNLEGGVILLGVEKDQRVTGLTRSLEEAEEWVMKHRPGQPSTCGRSGVEHGRHPEQHRGGGS